MTMTAKSIIIDCDPGKDDAIALFLAMASEDELDILGITTVAGNVSLELTQKNARFLCEIAGRPDLPVFAGARSPLKLPLVTAEHVHGKSGLEGIEVVEPKMPEQTRGAQQFFIDTLSMAVEQSITLVATGPLTNIALLVSKHPELLTKIKQIIIMGGARLEGGNFSPSAEFNMVVDPHAAKIVLNCGLPLVVMGLDVTHQVRANKARREQIKNIDNKVARAASALLDYSHMQNNKRYAELGAAIHDPCTIAYLIKPSLFQGVECNISIETDSPLTLGHTAVDYWGVTDKPANALWIDLADADGFFQLLNERLERF